MFLDADGEEQTAVTFPRPGALHKAQWMAKLLYTLKLALMEQHIALLPQGTITTRQQVPKIRTFAIFITHIYAKWWLTCEKAVDAAWNDLKLYHHLQAYKAVDEGIAASAIKALERHRWYLTGEMLPLALFSSKVPNRVHQIWMRNFNFKISIWLALQFVPINIKMTFAKFWGIPLRFRGAT